MTFYDLFTQMTVVDFLVFVFAFALLCGALMLVARFVGWLNYLATTKVCPTCCERVKTAASKCKHCHEMFAPIATGSAAEASVAPM